MQPKPYFHLVFRPNIKLVSTVRRFTGDFYRRILGDQDVSARLALATHELLENAVSYATDPETSIEIDVEGDTLTVKTWNRSSPERIAGLRALLDTIAAAPDPMAFYQELLEQSLARTDGSGLGLARVRAEAEMVLNHEIEQDLVCIRATTKLAHGVAA